MLMVWFFSDNNLSVFKLLNLMCHSLIHLISLFLF
jgi:hypothetical protein